VRVLFTCDFHVKYTVNQAAALQALGADVALLLRSHAYEFGGSRNERDRVLGRLNGAAVTFLPGRISSPAAALHVPRIRRWMAAWRPDVVHAHEHHDPRLLALAHGFPRVTTVHDPVPHPGHLVPNRVERGVHRRLVSGSDAVVVHGQSLIDELPPWVARSRVHVIPHGMAVRPAPLSRPDRATVLLFGRMEPYKGLDVLLDAMRRVWDVRPDVRLLVAGAGSETSKVPADPRIELRDSYIPVEELDAVFGEATLVVLPYTQASQSGVAEHSLGRGVPTIVSEIGALGDLALDPSFAVPPGDEVALADAILRHLDHGDARRAEVVTYARERFSWETCARRSLELYREVGAGA
jgi:glycosyltransferase involved in cell wall biosynthesis